MLIANDWYMGIKLYKDGDQIDLKHNTTLRLIITIIQSEELLCAPRYDSVDILYKTFKYSNKNYVSDI